MKIIAANWKLFKSPLQARVFLSEFKQKCTPEMLFAKKTEVVIFPSAIALDAVADELNGSPIQFGLQNAYFQAEGAFTGENSAAVAQSLGAQYILIGHSERRSLFGEGADLLAKKVAYVQSLDLTPMLCIGETLVERESGQTSQVLKAQLQSGLAQAQPQKSLVIAYEPVWAIGTGKVATPEQVAETHSQVAQMLTELGFANTAILYGGSVKPDNAAVLSQQKNVSGFLIGGASLEVDSLLKIIG